LIVAIPLLIAAYFVRRFVRHNAPFYATSNILIVGAVIGVGAICAVWVLLQASGLPKALDWIGLILGLAAVAAIAIRPDRIDWAKKSRPTAIVAAIVYAVSAGASFLVLR
jgi:hypothetical protein